MRATAALLPILLAGALSAQSVDDPRLRVETWASAGLSRPACVAFVGPEELLVFENRDGRVQRIQQGVIQNTALDLLVADKGGLGIVCDPDFASNGYVYLYYATTSGAEGGPWAESRLVRATFDGALLSNLTPPLFTVPFDPAQANPPDHNSGLLRFGPDGMLYGQVGDKDRGQMASQRIEQNTGGAASASAGGIFRLLTDGSVPPDNPFVGVVPSSVEPWYVYGFRNSLGMDFDPVTGTLWFGENGPTVYDEIDRAGAGMNSGWLKIMGPDSRQATYAENGNTPFDAADLVSLPGSFYRDPAFSFLDPIGITALCFLRSKRFDEDLRDILLVGESNFGQLYRFDLDAMREGFVLAGGLADLVADNAAERNALRFGGDFGTVTDMVVGPDGYVYATSHYNGAIYRIRPLVDLVEPAAMTVVRGRLSGGTLEDLELSDDRSVGLRADPVAGLLERRVLEVELYLNGPSPERMDVIVEARSSRPYGRQRIEAWHVPTASWRLLDERAVSIQDLVVLLPNIAAPGEYVDPVGNAVRLRVDHLSLTRRLARVLGFGHVPALESFVDQIRLRVALP